MNDNQSALDKAIHMVQKGGNPNRLHIGGVWFEITTERTGGLLGLLSAPQLRIKAGGRVVSRDEAMDMLA